MTACICKVESNEKNALKTQTLANVSSMFCVWRATLDQQLEIVIGAIVRIFISQTLSRLLVSLLPIENCAHHCWILLIFSFAILRFRLAKVARMWVLFALRFLVAVLSFIWDYPQFCWCCCSATKISDALARRLQFVFRLWLQHFVHTPYTWWLQCFSLRKGFKVCTVHHAGWKWGRMSKYAIIRGLCGSALAV